MSVTVLRFLLVLGIIGHAVNMYCDRIISIFPNGRLKIEDIKTIGEEGKMAKLMEGVSEKVPMRSAVWGTYSLGCSFSDILRSRRTSMESPKSMAQSCSRRSSCSSQSERRIM